ncbi:MAG: hypothetical protein ACKOXB_11690 [Flavobacteriales bacterium]
MSHLKTSLHYFGIIMLAVYVGMAFIMFFSDEMEKKVDQPMRSILAVLFLLYAAFKAYRIFAPKRSNSDEEL